MEIALSAVTESISFVCVYDVDDKHNIFTVLCNTSII